MLQKKLANLGTLLSRDAQKKIVGGNEEPIDSKDGKSCKTDPCSFLTITGGVYSGQCGGVITGTGPMLDVCACTYNGVKQAAPECNSF